MIEKGLRYV